MEPLKSKEFKCAMCGDIFEEAWTEGECNEEYMKNFGKAPSEKDSSIVCDDCYNKIMLQIKN